MIDERENAIKILNYWYAIESLSQDKYPDKRRVKRNVEKYKQNINNGKINRKVEKRSIETSIDLYTEDIKKSLYNIICDETKSCQMQTWGNITIYIGKVKREKCIEAIVQALPLDLGNNRPEKNSDYIALASLQLSENGDYIKHSLSLSPVLWALNQIKNSKQNLSKVLDNKEYVLSVEKLENKIFEEPKENNPDSDRTIVTEDEDEFQTFNVSAVPLNLLQKLFKEIENVYLKNNITCENNDYQEIYSISFRMFKNNDEKNDHGEDNYLGLNLDYFSDDIKMILNLMENNELSKDKYLGKDIQEYITTLLDQNRNKSHRFNVIKSSNLELYKKNLFELLRIENAPLGKWPSRFMPALMQQIVINLAVGKGKSELFEVNGKIFSVNGPPGTGKTTLLKEIVVNNIIERAQLLSKYETPDDAFEERKFLHGSRDQKRYSKFIPGWYQLKNDEINNYSILVTSCNNAAVENISKELPKNVGNDLKKLTSDSEELGSQLREVENLFNVNKSEVKEIIQNEECSDIYFTEYTKKLLKTDDVWGLIAAPLGKKSNINDFVYSVLYPISRNFYKNNNMIAHRIAKYRKARKDFLQQLKIVKDQQKEMIAIERLICSLSQATLEMKQSKRKTKDLQLKYEKISNINNKEILKNDKICEDKTKQKGLKINELKEIQENLENKQYTQQKIHTAANQLLEKECAQRDSICWLTKIFNKRKYLAKIRLADEYKKDYEEQKHVEECLLEEISGLEEKESQMKDEIHKLAAEIDQLKNQIIVMNDQIEIVKENKISLELENQSILDQYIKVKGDVETKLMELSGKADIDQMTVLNDKFIQDLLSKDINIATKAQVANPWFTQRYNREREKLFALAMRVNKEFVISSKNCRRNFGTLLQYWGFKDRGDDEKIKFHEEDKKRILPALIQTLFLLVPVISSTFASVGTFLKDVQKSGVIGLVIVDEAGQAQPQMALGALYRSRKALIVGDPKQVEPVVTDDLQLLKKAYNDELLKLYKDKTLSVQSFADSLNLFGTYLDNGSEYPEWIGCPLLVHRRCISPMYDISNQLSYNGIMKQQTQEPKKEIAETFIYETSRWINVVGREKENKNHFIEEQARKVCEMLECAFAKNPEPSIYIISPFTTVVSGMENYIEEYCKRNSNTKINLKYFSKMKRIGTVHTFQGKEANEVIFILGCDTSRGSEGAIRWVNENIINVAATRAKYRLYIIGDENAWSKSLCVREAKQIMDTFVIKKIKEVLEKKLPEKEKRKALLDFSNALPPVSQFTTPKIAEDGDRDYDIRTDGLIQGLSKEFIDTNLSKQQLAKFGFESMKDLDMFSKEVKENLVLGMKIFFLFEPVYKINNQMDASCCAILFCKALELRMKDCFWKSLKEFLPDFEIIVNGTNKKMSITKKKEFMLGTFITILKNQKNKGKILKNINENSNINYDKQWLELFINRLIKCKNIRNACCHSEPFKWDKLVLLNKGMFEEYEKNGIEMKGLMIECAIGWKIKNNKNYVRGKKQ